MAVVAGTVVAGMVAVVVGMAAVGMAAVGTVAVGMVAVAGQDGPGVLVVGGVRGFMSARGIRTIILISQRPR
jgi:hypothetical protein